MSRKQPTFADYLVIAITPALIMLLICSLVFFLLTAFFDGQYEARVRYVFSLFIFAAVLIGRISIEDSQEQAVLYGIPLAIVTWLALGHFCDTNSLVTIIMIAITWWSAHKLTWDCTVIDEAEEAESGGLLQSAGFEAEDPNHGSPGHGSPDQTLERDLSAGDDSNSDRPSSLRDLWQRWIEDRKKPHSPGVWVIYFALATLPLFGVGQWAIPAADQAARRSAFHCLLVYVTCAMTLLGTTSFLGIRRYLRQRKLEMPADMALGWAGGVAGIMFAILLVASCLPRPKPEYSISQVVGSRDIDRPSPFSLLKKDGVDSPDGDEQDDESSQKSNRTSKQPSPNKTPSADGQRSAKGSDESQRGSAESESDSGQQGSSDSDESQQGIGERTEQDDDSSDRSQRQIPPEQQGNSADKSQPPETQRQDAREISQRESSEEKPSDRSDNTPPRSPQQVLKPILDSLGGGIAAVLRILYWLVMIGAVSYFCWRYAGAILAALRTFFSDLFSLFGRQESPGNESGEEADSETTSSRQPFASFTDPTQSGESMSDRELVRYTFLALEAWAYENDCGRTIDETPFEFEKRLARSFPHMRDATVYAVQYYDRMAYANSTPRLSRERLGQLWQFMRTSK